LLDADSFVPERNTDERIIGSVIDGTAVVVARTSDEAVATRATDLDTRGIKRAIVCRVAAAATHRVSPTTRYVAIVVDTVTVALARDAVVAHRRWGE
jgi:hypothetical protein